MQQIAFLREQIIEWKIRSKLTPVRQFKVIPFANGN